MRRLQYSARARADQVNIARHIAIDNSAAAVEVLDRIDERCEGLVDFPEQGRALTGGRRVLAITGTAYLAFYRVKGDTITVLHIRHGKRRPQH